MLAAVAVAGLLLSAISGVVAVTFAGVRSAADRASLAEAGRTLLASLPRGDALQDGRTAGMLGRTRWRIDVATLADPAATRPPSAPAADPGAPASTPVQWLPASVAVVVTNPSGRSLRLDTIGLIRRITP